ncbi:MAG: T9SS type A sorting domain-containing protein [Bacteroidota bacterium]
MFNLNFTKALLFSLFFLTASSAFSRKFYFSSSTGSDSYSVTQAQNIATPWKTLQKLQTLITNGNTTFLPGDTIAFKRGDVFDNGHTAATGFEYVSCSWVNYPAYGYTAPSGTQQNPIVLTSYGDLSLPKPNFIYPTASTPLSSNSNNVIEFAGVSWIIIDGLQFNDFRFPQADKANPAYTRSAIIFGEWTQSRLASNGVDTIFGSNRDTTNRKWMVKNCTVKNCYFSNVSFALGSIAAINCNLQYNTIENLKTTADTTGTSDIMAGAFEAINGFHINISHNYIKGAWGRSGRVSDCFGLGGVAIDMFCVKYSNFSYNTVIDCSGLFEIGNTDRYDILNGSWYDTFAYNKVINCGQLGYIHGSPGDVFSGNNRNISCINNVFINNNSSRMSGPNFGNDLYNDGQSFRGDANGNYKWWFFRSPTKCPDNTLPISNQNWSNPINPPYCNYYGHRTTIQYSSDDIRGNADTLVDLRNNIFYSTVGDQLIYDASRTKFKHRNNIYYIKGGFLNPTTLGGTLGIGELITTNQIFVDTSSSLPENWDLHLSSNSQAIGAGVSVGGLSTDFAGSSINSVPDIGIYKYSSTTPTPPPTNSLNATATFTAITCNGGNSTVTVSVTGGTSPYTGTGNFTAIAGTRSFIVSDVFGLRDTVTISISQPSLISASISAGTISAYGGSTTITTTASGGTGTLSYKLDNGTYQASGVFNSVLAGAHSVTVKDANGCTKITSITINQPLAVILNANATFTAITCNGGSSIVTVSATGGTSPYTGTGNFTASAGLHSYIVSDATGAKDTVTMTINQPLIISVTVASGTITTVGGTTSIQVSATGGTGTTYQYSLDGGVYQTSNTFAAVAAGNHNVNVKDINGCIVTKSFLINAPVASTLSASSTAGAIICNGATTTVTVTATGGVAPYTGTGSFSAVAGTSNYTVRDAAGSTSSTSITISQPTLINATLSSGTISTNGGSTTLTTTASGGTGVLTYKLDNGTFQASGVFNGVLAGIHNVIVKDANGCTKTISITITQPTSSTLNASSTFGSILCNGMSTTVTVTASGGIPPYTGIGSFSVNAGSYSYTVRDAAGATASTSVNITQPLSLNSTATSGIITSAGGTTSITISASGGTSPYTFKLNNGTYQTSNIFNAVSSGNYTINVKDVNGCIKSSSINILQPQPFAANVTAGLISCFGGSAPVTVTATGGTAPYSGTGSFSVVAGTYTYTVTDANNLTSSSTVTITQPTAITATISVGGAITVNGGTTSLTVNASGGSSPYTYSIDNRAFQSSNVFNSVIAGRHTITIKDRNGCILNRIKTISQPTATGRLVVTAIAGEIACNGGTTTVRVTASGGTAPYSGLGIFTTAAGEHTFSVSDAAGNSANETILITQPIEISISVNVANNIYTIGGTTTVTINANGGTGSYLYSMDGGTSQSSTIFSSVGAGIHTVAVVDLNGCMRTTNFTVTQSTTSGLIASLVSKTNVTCINGNDGSLEVRAAGGRAPYTFAIENSTFSANNIFNNLRSGTYHITVKDANNSIAVLTVIIENGRQQCSNNINPVITINTYPNPSNAYFNLKINSDSQEDVNIEVMDLYGRKVYQSSGSINNTYSFGQNFIAGPYFVRVMQGNTKSIQKIIKL